MKHLTGIILLLLTMVAAQSHAYDFEVDGVYYNILSLSDFTCTVTSGDYHYGREVVIPSTVTYKSKEVTVVAIDSAAFAGSTDMMSIVIPHTVDKIGNKAFEGCTGLKKVVIEDGSSILQLGYNYYNSSSPAGETEGLFHEGAIESLYLGRNLSYMMKGPGGFSPFDSCKNLKEVTIGNTVTSIPNQLFRFCTSLTEIDIPENVTQIYENAFSNCHSLKRVTIPNTIQKIRGGAFGHCTSLTTITIPNTITTIDLGTFHGCTSLREFDIPNSVKDIDDNAFYGCSNLTNVTFPPSVTSIGKDAFHGCSSITNVIIPNSVTYIGFRAFEGCI